MRLRYEMSATFHLQAGMADLIREMIEGYVPLNEDVTASTRRKVKEDFMVLSWKCRVVSCRQELLKDMTCRVPLTCRQNVGDM